MSEKSSASMKIHTRTILLAMVVVATLVLIIRNIDVSKNILLVLLGFGAVVLVHEFGHFVVAKMCGIKVEAFSIGFPPILLGIKKANLGWRIRILPELLRDARLGEDDVEVAEGTEAPSHSGEGEDSEDGLLSFTVGKKILPGETEYRIGLIPFGGFVKMLGQDDVGPTKVNDDPRSYANKPALARAAVLAAGVTFNVISAAIVYMIVFLMGIGLLAPIVGGVKPGSPAEKAGIRSGDEVIEVAGDSGRLDFSDIMMAAVLSAKNEAIPLKVRRTDGTIDDISLAAEQLPGGQFREFGIQRAYSLTVAKLLPEDANRLFENTGLLPGDRIRTVAGVDVNNHWQIEPIIESSFEPNITLLAERREASGQSRLIEGRLALSFMFTPAENFVGESEANLANICSMTPRLRIAAVSEEPKSFREWFLRLFGIGNERQRLKRGDIVVELADVNNPTFTEMREITKAHENNDLAVTVLRTDANGIEKRLTVSVIPRRESDSNRVVIGILPELDTEHPVVAKTIATERHPNPLAIPRGATITAIDGVEVSNFYDVARRLKQNSNQRITIDWRLDAQTAGNTIVDVGEKRDVVTAYAFVEQPVPFAELERLYKADGPVDAIRMGYKRTKTFIIQTYVTLHRLVGGLVSPKQLMGPVGILTFSYRIVAAQPFIYYIYFLGLISASIAVLNFLPLPPFDGGLTVLLLVEKIKGSAISVRTQEIIAYVAWGLVGSLMLYVTFNDILRLIFGFFV
ncbi:MAG: site-2 protease family protein [Sedimentisphaerales bacterium]